MQSILRASAASCRYENGRHKTEIKIVFDAN